MGSLNSGVQSVGFSDHSLVYVTLKASIPKFTPKISTFRSFRYFDESLFLQDLAAIDWNYFFSESQDVDEMWGKFKSIFVQLSNKHAPFTTVRKKQNGSPWINDEYLHLARERNYNKQNFSKRKILYIGRDLHILEIKQIS